MSDIKAKAILFILMGLCIHAGYSKNLGQYGHVFEIIETNMLDFIYERLTHLEKTGALEKLKSEAISRVKQSMVRPHATKLPTTTKPKTFYYTPSFTLQADIVDYQGRVLYPKGTTYNAMDPNTYPNNLGKHFKFPQYADHLLFFDGDDIQQVNWAKAYINTLDQQRERYRLILTHGNIKESMQIFNRPVQFNQQGWITQKLGIQHVPSVLTQDGVRFKIQEINVARYSLKPTSEAAPCEN